MSVLEVKSKKDCKYDILSLGEIMLRLGPRTLLLSVSLKWKKL